jgi:hypothetical protein
MGAPCKQKQLSKIESDMSVISKIKPKMNLLVQRSFSDSGNGRLMMSRGTQVHVESLGTYQVAQRSNNGLKFNCR